MIELNIGGRGTGKTHYILSELPEGSVIITANNHEKNILKGCYVGFNDYTIMTHFEWCRLFPHERNAFKKVYIYNLTTYLEKTIAHQNITVEFNGEPLTHSWSPINGYNELETKYRQDLQNKIDVYEERDRILNELFKKLFINLDIENPFKQLKKP